MTPTEDLIMEVLAARTRLGHILWTFAANRTATAAARSLERRGLITMMHGITERTFRARLTQAGRDEYLTPDYVAPILGGPK
ncbi:hypothetical protein OED52_13675 [Rhodococcus sp. Z13]|uniref:Uncharacterized protein n=1 Tax=Rhodococcus sacchari TaxID=2962047 RepID=A0ACD4DCG0_9NOCA|nr:hypothetical protein [Rhodococcus sp. Z13]UYP17721.1 hypothetical protein OED52_13675 [Rhodococcus sp. Z13]